jgi:hypothetical protein
MTDHLESVKNATGARTLLQAESLPVHRPARRAGAWSQRMSIMRPDGARKAGSTPIAPSGRNRLHGPGDPRPLAWAVVLQAFSLPEDARKSVRAPERYPYFRALSRAID